MGHAAMVEALLVRGADSNADGQLGTPLHQAVSEGHAGAGAKLIVGRADVNLRSTHPKSWWRGRAPLHVALYVSSAARDRMVEMLLAAGADPGVATESGNTALHLAASDERMRLV